MMSVHPSLGSRTLPYRSRKKQQTRAGILENAIALFRSHGIRGTKSSQIAAAADVSPATLFNYFPTKADLAEAWVRGEIVQILASLSAESTERSLRSALRSVCADLASRTTTEPAIRQEAWRIAGRAMGSAIDSLGSLEGWVEIEQDRGRVRADLSARTIAQSLLDAIESGLIEGSKERQEARECAATLRGRIDLVLDGVRKKNERVAPPGPR